MNTDAMDIESFITSCSQLRQDSDKSSTSPPTTATPTTVALTSDAGDFILNMFL